MDGMIDFPLPRPGPIDTRRDKAFLAVIAKTAVRYGHWLEDHPDRRRPMPLALMHDLGFRHAAAELQKQALQRQGYDFRQTRNFDRGRKATIRRGD